MNMLSGNKDQSENEAFKKLTLGRCSYNAPPRPAPSRLALSRPSSCPALQRPPLPCPVAHPCPCPAPPRPAPAYSIVQ